MNYVAPAIAEQDEKPAIKYAKRTSAPSRTMRLVLGLTVLIAYTAGLVVVPTYISFKFPIKTDRYRHSFSQHLADRLEAYILLFKSRSKSKNLTLSVEKIHQIIANTSAQYGVDPCLVNAVALYESGLNPDTITTTGAIGLMALQPETARRLSLQDPFDPYANVDGGTRLLKQLSHDFDSNLDLILAAYNAGPGAVKKNHGVPPFPETMDYVKYAGDIYSLCKSRPEAFSTKLMTPN